MEDIEIEFYVPKKTRKDTVTSLAKHFDKKFCKDIENGIYDYTKQFCQSDYKKMGMATSIYNDVTHNIIFNCEQNHDTMKKIKKDISKKKFNPYNLGFLRPDELDKDAWIKIIVRKANTEEKLNNLATVQWKPCFLCKSKEYFFYQLQTRSADEPMTSFYICKQCNKTYRINN